MTPNRCLYLSHLAFFFHLLPRHCLYPSLISELHSRGYNNVPMKVAASRNSEEFEGGLFDKVGADFKPVVKMSISKVAC